MTSIEWFIQEVEIYGTGNFRNLFKETIELAKEMHKAEIEEAFKHGKLPPFLGQVQTAKEYYQETFKKDVEKEMFELEQQLDIPSHMRWHNRELPQQETLYTEEQVREALSESFKASQEGYNITSDEIIQSLKPKKD